MITLFEPHNLLFSIIIIFLIQILFFIFASIFKTDKVTDLAYGITFVILSWILYLKTDTQYPTQLILAIAISIWGLRLAGYLFYRIVKIKKDERFNGIRENFWKFATFWSFQTIVIFAIMLPAIIFLSSKEYVGYTTIGLIGFLIWIIGFVIESIADHQKFTFRNHKENDGKWVDIGLWRYSRHPNYFGEMLCWIGIFLYIIPILSGITWISIIGPLTIIITLRYFSGVPMLEKREDKVYGHKIGYRRYKASTNMLIPWFK